MTTETGNKHRVIHVVTVKLRSRVKLFAIEDNLI